MFDRLKALEERYEQLTRELGDPASLESPDNYRKTGQAHAALSRAVERYRAHRSILQQIEETQRLLNEESDSEILELARAELLELEGEKAESEAQLRVLLLPTDPNDRRNAILEIRAGTGGDEATLFVQDLFRMYTRYAEGRGWKTDVVAMRDSPVGGLKEIVASVEGKGVYSRLKYESGVHRVQRVPETETQGRIHTSAVTVAVLPEADEVEVQVDPKDLRVDTFCSSGPGGQSVNTTYSAVRITHLPTGEVVTCQDEKSQIKNKNQAMKVLRSRLYDKATQEQQNQIAESRRAMVGSGDRSEKIRTYNFPQNRITDHRISLSLHRLDKVLGGDLDLLVEALAAFQRDEALKDQKIA